MDLSGGSSHAPPLVKDTRKGVAQGSWTRNERMATRLTAHVCTRLFKYLQRDRIGELTAKGFVKMQSFELNFELEVLFLFTVWAS